MKKISPTEFAQKKDPKEMKKIIDDHYVLLCSMAKKFSTQHASQDDLISEGTLGLIIAINKFDPTKNIKFSTYAYYWIKNKIFAFISKKTSETKVRDVLFDHFNFSQDQHINIENTSVQNISYPINEFTLHIKNYAFEVFINMVSEQKRQVILLRYKGQTLEEIAQTMKLSKERIRQIEKQFAKEFKHYVQNVLKIETLHAYICLNIVCEIITFIENSYQFIHTTLSFQIFLLLEQ